MRGVKRATGVFCLDGAPLVSLLPMIIPPMSPDTGSDNADMFSMESLRDVECYWLIRALFLSLEARARGKEVLMC